MIRTVLAVLITVALVGMAWPAVGTMAADRAEHEARVEADELRVAAEALLRAEQAPPPGVQGPTRTVHVELPEGSLLTSEVETFVVDGGENVTVVRYAVEGGGRGRVLIDAPIRGTTRLGGATDTYIRLTLRRSDSGEPVIVLTPGA